MRRFDTIMLPVSLFALTLDFLTKGGLGWLLILCVAYFAFMTYGHHKGWKR